MKKPRLAPAIPSAMAAVAILSSCAALSPESRLRSGLIDAGLNPQIAACMAPRMADRLSLLQLRKLQSLSTLRKSHSEPVTLNQWLHKARALGDAEIVSVTAGAALRCAI